MGSTWCRKTTLAQIIANKLNSFYILSAIASGVKDVRNVIERAKNGRFFNSPSPILFIDEIHRINKNIEISHVGSTSIPSIKYGKNIIDILIGTKDKKEFAE